MVTSEQFVRRWDVNLRSAQHRLRALIDLGLVERARPLVDAPPAYLSTRLGLDRVELTLPAPRVDLRTWEHDLAVVDHAIALESEGWELTTEREMRSIDGWEQSDKPPRWAVDLGRSEDGRRRRHFPDLGAVKGGKAVAWEIEITLKNQPRLRRIFNAYRWADHYDSVEYRVLRPAVHTRLSGLVAEENVGHKVTVVYAGQGR